MSMCLDLPSDLSEFSVTVRNWLSDNDGDTVLASDPVPVKRKTGAVQAQIARQIAERALALKATPCAGVQAPRRFADNLAILSEALPVDPDRAGLGMVDPRDTLPARSRNFADGMAILSAAIPEKLTLADISESPRSSGERVKADTKQSQCCATAQSTGERCRLKAAKGRLVCHLHGRRASS